MTTKCSVLLFLVFLFLGIFFPANCRIRGEEVVDTLIRRAQEELGKGHPGQARTVIYEIKRRDPKNPALPDLENRVEAAVSKEVKESLDKGLFALSCHRYPEARRALRNVLLLDPSNTTAEEALLKVNKAQREIDAFREAGMLVEQTSTSPRRFDGQDFAVRFRARHAFDHGDYGEALQVLDMALARDPGNSEAKALREQVLQAREQQRTLAHIQNSATSGNGMELLDTVESLVQSRPGNGKAVFWRGKILLQEGRFEPALKDFTLALQLGIPVSQLRGPMALAHAGLGNFSEAMALGTPDPAGTFGISTGTLWRWYWNAYRASCLFLLFAGAVLAFGLWTFLQNLRRLFAVRPPGLVIRTGLYFLKTLFIGPAGNHEEGVVLAGEWDTPWFSYLAGSLFLKGDRLEEAREHFRRCLGSMGLRPRACLFLALLQDQKNPEGKEKFESLFQEALSERLKRHPRFWHPRFLRKLEAANLEGLRSRFPIADPEAFPLAQALIA